MEKERKEYTEDLPRRLYSYFVTYDNPAGLPSFSKFARSIGITTAELRTYRENSEFERAWQECTEIRRDYLIDLAISKRADATFSKFLLSGGDMADDEEDSSLSVTLSVIE